MDVCVFFPLHVWQPESCTLTVSCIVQWQNVYLALLLLPSAHSLKEKSNGFKPNGATPSEVTSTSFKGSSFTLPPAGLLAHLLERNSRSTVRIHFARLFSAIFRLIVLALQCCLKRSVCSFYDDKLSQRSLLWKLGNCQHTFSGISLKKKKSRRKRRKKRTKAFYCPVYMKVYV